MSILILKNFVPNEAITTEAKPKQFKRMLFYILVAVTSYFGGLSAYLAFLSIVYDQGLGSESKLLIGWTLAPYLFLILPCYTLLFRWSRAMIWLRIILLIGLSFLAAASVPFLIGFGFGKLSHLFSPEIGAFAILFASSSIVFTIGSLVSLKERGYLLFMLAALVLIIYPSLTLAAEAEKSRPTIHEIPQSFHGTVSIHYGVPDYPPIPKIKGYQVISIPEDGIYKTSSPRPPRGIRHTLVDEKGKEIRPLTINGEMMRLGSQPAMTISEYEVP
ncbi:DUF6843 domain-containing protein [Paenibacillus paridis]|uniref:DUF6843 domain-containing protein n=1 Tax=Paenibacillus paridis TaxID=2583376 RepID=UPI0011214A10|nr:hypothetical protein [Paenibacillus paridis]